MKKNFIAMLLCATVFSLFFASCKKEKEEGSEGTSSVTSLTVRPSSLDIAVGESTRLSVAYEPSTATPTIKWESSDETVVTVSDNGTIEALAVGTANVTASCGDVKAVCAVTVKDYFETLTFTGAFVYNYDTTYSNTLDTLRSESWGSQYFVAKKVLCNVELFTEGFYVNDEWELAGAEKGAILEFEAPFYWAPAWANDGRGTIFVLGNWLITEDYPDSTVTVGRPYSIDEKAYVAAVNQFVQDYYVAGDASKAGQDLALAGEQVKGARLTQFEYHSIEEGYSSDGYFSSYIPDLVISEGDMEFDDNYAASGVMCSVTYHAIKGKEFQFSADTISGDVYTYGVHFKETENSIDLVDNNVHFGAERSFEYGVKPASAPAKRVMRPIKVHQLTPEQLKFYREQKNRPMVKQNLK